jgi:hypothetical protein
MKKIELKNAERTNERPCASWKDLALLSMRQVSPNTSLNVEQIGERLKVLKKIQTCNAGATLQLEDAEFKTFNECAQSVAWQLVDEDLFEFLSTVKKIAES